MVKGLSKRSTFLEVSERNYQQNNNKAKRTNYLLNQLFRNERATPSNKSPKV